MPKSNIRQAAVPNHVVIVGLGPSMTAYVDLTKCLGGRKAYADEVWGINAAGDVIACDRIFHMDDVRIQEIRAAERPKSNIANMLAWLKTHPGPIYTSRPHPDYPGLVAFPLEAVMNNLGTAYFNSTAAYAVAYAIHIGVKKISLFGCDFTYPNAHQAEKGRACVEFYLGMAQQRGIALGLPASTSLLDGLESQADRIYGYDTIDLTFRRPAGGGPLKVVMKPHTRLPTADEVEARYDHSKHPNGYMQEQQP